MNERRLDKGVIGHKRRLDKREKLCGMDRFYVLGMVE